jgi:hypothetical protein
MYIGWCKDASSIKDASGMIQGYFNNTSIILQECLKDDSKMHHAVMV